MSRKQVRTTRYLPAAALAGLLLLALAVGCSSYTEPVWTSVAKLEGTSFVTDGTIAIDMQLVGATPPPTQSASKWFSDSIFANRNADVPEQFALDEMHASAADPAIFVGPGEQQIEEKHIDYLSGALSGHRVAFWQAAAMEPVIIVVDGLPVGAMKALN